MHRGPPADTRRERNSKLTGKTGQSGMLSTICTKGPIGTAESITYNPSLAGPERQSPMIYRPFRLGSVAIRLAIISAALMAGLSTPEAFGQSASAGFLERLEQRVAERPDDPSAWRLLGRALEKEGDYDGAFEAFQKATELDPLNAAAKFDLANWHLNAGNEQLAANHFADVVRIAPDSSYAKEADNLLQSLPEPAGQVKKVGFEIRRFDRTDQVPSLRPPAERLPDILAEAEVEDLPDPLTLRLEAGLLFNTNVAMAPTSRGLAVDSAESLQGFLNPEIEYAVWNHSDWRAGPTFQGYFNVNENDYQVLNLTSYQPGLFFERLITGEFAVFVPRLAYNFTYDAFDGDTFARRHSLSLSTNVVWPSMNESNVYWVSDFTNFASDGDNPAVTSRDGWANTVGASHRLYLEESWLQSIAAGIEGQMARTDGVNFTYNGLSLYSDAEIPLLPQLTLLVNGSWAYRSYPDADLDPSRNEHIWHAGARLRYDLTPNWSVAAVFNYDRFDSKNELFKTDRTIAGLTTTFEY